MTIASDKPINDPAQDRFNRWSFAQRIAQTIVSRKDPSSIVIGIYGSWGDGKTTVLNFIEKELSQQPNIITYKFNPWRFSDENKMLIGFFHSLANALGKSEKNVKEKIGDWIGKYVSTIASAFGKAEAAEKLGKLLSSTELEETKTRVNGILKDAGKRIIVLIDDIDRLDKNEIQFLFRLVKLNADFVNTAYVLAFDDDMVTAALQEKYSAAGSESGRGFLEKIIQVPLDLPAIPLALLRDFCFSTIDQAIKEAGINLSEEDVNAFVRGYIDGLEIRVKTPRMATRYSNILAFSLPILKGEVYPVDLMLVEGIRLFYPRLYETVKRNPDIFLGSTIYLTASYDDQQIKKIKEVIESGIKDLITDEKQAALKLLQYIFPKLQRIYSNVYYGRDSIKALSQLKRIASEDYFPRYFSYSIIESDVSDVVLEQLLSSLTEKSNSEVTNTFNDLFETKDNDKLISKLRQKADKLSDKSALKLAFLVAANGGRFPNPDQLFSFRGPFSQAAMLVGELLEKIQNKEDRLNYAKQLIAIADPISFAIEITRWIRDIEQDANPSSLTPDEKSTLKRILADRIKQASTTENILTKYLNDAGTILSIWANWGSKEEESNYLEGLFIQDPKQIILLLNCVVPTEWEMGNGIGKKSDLDRPVYDYLDKIIDATKVMTILEKIYGSELFTKEYPDEESGENVDLRLAQQFAWIYKIIHKETE